MQVHKLKNQDLSPVQVIEHAYPYHEAKYLEC